MDLNIIPECYIDTNLLETLVPPTTRYNHQKGCGTVAKVMQERFADSFALGIIDKDKKDIEYLKEFNSAHAHGNLILHKHRVKHHYIIQISPAIEQFTLNAANAADIRLEDYDLPSSLNALMKISKSVNSKADLRFKKLFRALVNSGSTELSVLRSWIEHIKSNPYNINIETIRLLCLK